MLRRMKQNTPQIENTIAKAVNFEIQTTDIVQRDRKRSSAVAWLSTLMCVMMALSYVLILPIEKIERFMVMADPYTNANRIASLDDDNAFLSIVSKDAVLKRSVTDYVRARESFNFPSTGFRDFHLVKWKSVPEVFNSYTALHDKENPDEPYKEFGVQKAIRINFVDTDIRRVGDELDMRYEAVVRLQRFAFEKSTGTTKLHDSKIAFVEFTYDRKLLANPAQRQNNPLGFLVTAYRVDNDFSAAPPPRDDVALNPQQTSSQQAAFANQSAGGKPFSQPPAGASSTQGQQIPQFGAPPAGAAPNAQPQSQFPAQPAVQPQPAAPAGQAPNQVNGVRN
jgi:type IV secretion system protein VirB8